MSKNFAIVTGASSGLGVDFATVLAEKGHHLILVARREDRLQSLKSKLEADHSVKVEVIAQDLAKEDAGLELYTKVKALRVTVDILVNNAGLGLYGLFQDISWEREAKMMQLDMVTLVQLTKLFSADMVAQGHGHILQVGSIGAYQATPTYASYAAAKSFVYNFSEAINFELKGTGVSVTTINPGVTATEFFETSGQKPTLYQRLAIMKSRPVAEIGIQAMFKRKTVVVPGLMNKLTVWSTKFFPRFMATRTAYMTMKSPDAELRAATV